MKMQKTNVMRLLDQQKIRYTAAYYSVQDQKLDGISVAQKTGQPTCQVFKTLVCQGATNHLYVFCIPVEQELSLRRAARISGEKNISMLPQSELLNRVGFQHGGCSPIGMKKKYPTFVEQSAISLATMFVSGGQIGVQIQLSPADLIAATQAEWFDNSKD